MHDHLAAALWKWVLDGPRVLLALLDPDDEPDSALMGDSAKPLGRPPVKATAFSAPVAETSAVADRPCLAGGGDLILWATTTQLLA